MFAVDIDLITRNEQQLQLTTKLVQRATAYSLEVSAENAIHKPDYDG